MMGQLAFPEGPLTAEEHKFYDALHDLHRRAGRPSTRRMGTDAGASRGTIHDVFTRSQNKHPTWGNVELIVEYLVATIPDAQLEDEKPHLHKLWNAAELSRRARLPPHTAPPPPRPTTKGTQVPAPPTTQDWTGEPQTVRVAAATKLVREQLEWPLSTAEHAILLTLARRATEASNGRLELATVAEAVVSATPHKSADLINAILRSLLARNYLRTSPSGRIEVSTEGHRELTRRRTKR